MANGVSAASARLLASSISGQDERRAERAATRATGKVSFSEILAARQNIPSGSTQPAKTSQSTIAGSVATGAPAQPSSKAAAPVTSLMTVASDNTAHLAASSSQQAALSKVARTANLPAQVAARDAYFERYQELLSKLTLAAAPTYSPSGTFDPVRGGYPLVLSGTPNSVPADYAKGGLKPIDGGVYIDPGAIDYARSFLTGANKTAVLPDAMASLQSELDAFRDSYPSGAPKVYPVLGSGSRPLLAKRMLAGLPTEDS